MNENYLTIKNASNWASSLFNKDITTSNISYLVQYGKIGRHIKDGVVCVSTSELHNYYNFFKRREAEWKQKLGNDLNWKLSFDTYKEKDTTKHVHRLHPYKGKFIPQLVEYFLDNHTDEFKKNVYFKKGDIVLDPFLGSGTTMVQANELGIHSIGIDISSFNCMISGAKLTSYDMDGLKDEVKNILNKINGYEIDSKIASFEKALVDELYSFNLKYFPTPEFKQKVDSKELDEKTFAEEKELEFLKIYDGLLLKHHVTLKDEVSRNNSFLDKWYSDNILEEIQFVFNLIKNIKNPTNKKILAIILSRTIRSCRATTHSDLATLKEPQFTTYYCHKHKKICKPLFSIKKMFSRYALDTIKRLDEFKKLRSDGKLSVISADSRTVNIESQVEERDKEFYKLLKKKKIKGIFTSPPYVGQIDYHEQHAYAYDLFGFERKDDLEIGPLYKGQGVEAKKSYVGGISDVLSNCKKYLVKNYDVFLVANDKYDLYPKIAEKSGMKIVNQFKRPVLNRTERDKNPYSETIFHLKEK
ncbi:MAG: DNA methyltransferase [Patescibacteria group bacterium]|nr:DNA methyltransferase [Patescibacteria group bacterium]